MLNNPIIMGGGSLPTLTNPGTAADLLMGKQLIGQDGTIVTGTMTQFISQLNRNSDGVFTPGYFDTSSRRPVTDLTLTNRGFVNIPFGSTWTRDWKKSRLIYIGPNQIHDFDTTDTWLLSMGVGYSAVIGMTLLFYYDNDQNEIRPTLFFLERRTYVSANNFSLDSTELSWNYNLTTGLYNSGLYLDIELTDGKTAFLDGHSAYVGPKGIYAPATYNVP